MTDRLQLALNVSDVEAAAAFYTKLFGVAPHKRRPGYVNFVVAEPALKLVLFENPQEAGTLNHLGVEVSSAGEVTAAAGRLAAAGLAVRSTEEEQCCHALQAKAYVDAPDVPLGFWEFYTVLDDDTADGASESSVCCATTTSEAACCATPA